MVTHTILLIAGVICLVAALVLVLWPRWIAAVPAFLGLLLMHWSYAIDVKTLTFIFWGAATLITVGLFNLSPKGEPDGSSASNLYVGFTAMAGGMLGIMLEPRVMVLGVILGALGVLYNKALEVSQNLQGMIRPRWLKALIASVIVVVMAYVYPMALGSGHSLVELAGSGLAGAGLLGTLLLIKFVYCVYSFGTGAPGGIFLPLLVLGALTGGLFTSIVTPIVGLPADNIGFYVIIGMAGLFASIVRAPLTGIILISEMTGALTNLLPLSLVALVSYITAEALGGIPVYDQLLDRLLSKN